MPYVCIHGLGQTPASWEKTMDALAVQAVCPDLAALLWDGEITYARLYEQVSACLADISGPLDLCGLSLGGVLALHYGIEHPERVRSLVLIGAQYAMPKRLLALQNLIFRFMPESAFRETGFGKRDFMELTRSMAELDLSGKLDRVACPALILCGEKDRANQKAARALTERLPHAAFETVEGAGHEVNADTPERLAELLRGFWKL